VSQQITEQFFLFHIQEDPSSDHTGKNLSDDRNRNCRRRGGIPTRKGTRDQITNLRISMHKACEH